MRKTEAIDAGLAPRYADGWLAVEALLSDGEPHAYEELEAVICGTGLAAASAANLLRDLRLDGWLQSSGRGRTRTFERLGSS